MDKSKSLPDVIVVFGSIGAGKGTQMAKLQERYGGVIIDNGAAFRKYAEFRSQEGHPEQQRAQKVHEDMIKGPIETEDMFYILEGTITEALSRGDLVIMDKPGGILAEEMRWFFNVLAVKHLSVTLLNLFIPVEVAVERISSRYYLPGSSKSYATLKEAQDAAIPSQEPFQRADGASHEITRNRYNTMYADLLGDVRSITTQFDISIYDIDGTKSIDDVFEKVVYTISDNKNHSYPCKK